MHLLTKKYYWEVKKWTAASFSISSFMNSAEEIFYDPNT